MVGALFAGLAMLLPSLGAYLCLIRLWPRTDAPSRALAAAVAPGLAIGVASFFYFGLLQLASNHQTAMRLDAGLWLVIDVCLLLDARRRRNAGSPPPDEKSRGATPAASSMLRAAFVVAAAGFIILLALAVWSFWLHYIVKPDGEWDAFAIWNLRARAIARGAPDWAAVLSPDLPWSQPNYPLLVPLSIARLWAYAGGESTAMPMTVALLFFLSSVAVVVIGVGRLRGWSIGLLAGMALLMSRTYVFQGACQCGDVPMGFYVLVAVCCVAMSLQADEPGPFLVTAGAAAGLAAWTKNEGLLLLAIVGVATCIRRTSKLRAAGQFAAGAAVPALVLAVFKLQVGSSSYLFEQQGGGTTVQKLIDVSRWSRVSERLGVLVPAWGAVPGGSLVCLALAALVAMRWERRSAGRAVFALLVVMAMFAGYILVYVVTPLPLEWQMNVSFDRLLVQLWPALVWAVFQLAGSADSAGRRSNVS